MEYINILFEIFYFKLIIGILMALILTFADDFKILKNKFILISIGLALILMLLNNIDDIGIILLLIALFIISYNNVMILHA